MAQGEIEIRRTESIRLIRAMSKPVWDSISDDTGIPWENYWPQPSEAERFYVSTHDGELCGMWLLQQRNHIMWQAHLFFLPKWHRQGVCVEHSKRALEFMFEDSGATAILAEAPTWNPRVALHAQEVGFIPCGTLPRCFSKHGDIYDIDLLIAHRN